MNPCFRYVKLRYIDIRKLSYSTVTALKQPDHVIQKDGRLYPNNWPEIEVCIKKRPKLAELLQLHEVGFSLQSQHGKGLENLPEQQKFDLEFLTGKQSNLSSEKTSACNTRNLWKRNKTDNKNIGAVFEQDDMDLRQICVSKNNSNVSQKENLAVTKDLNNHLPNRTFQNVGGDKKRSNKSDSDDKPTYAQLQKVANYYEEQLKSLHARSEDFSQGLHHNQIIFENNYLKVPASCRGLDKYRMALAKMRILGSFCYVTFRFQLAHGCTKYKGDCLDHILSDVGHASSTFTLPINISCDMDEGAVVLHWKMHYISNFRFFFHAVPRVLIDRSLRNAYDEDDAISTFYLNGQGQIVKHKVDKTIPIKGGKKKPVGLMMRVRKKFNLSLT